MITMHKTLDGFDHFCKDAPCNHAPDAPECSCDCHEPTPSGEPKVIHVMACCEPCERCGKNFVRNYLPE